MMEMCSDNRFELIAKYKQKLIEATNIETSPEEMAVIDVVLFRCWQMGWLDALEKQTPKKPIKKIFKINRWNWQAKFYCCPTCGKRVEVDDNEGYLTEHYPTCECGQRIDWNGVIPDTYMKWLEKLKEWSED